ncbi:MAG: hypothetical protein ABI210_15240, partial [Abditibacteriaceae bacterium]
ILVIRIFVRVKHEWLYRERRYCSHLKLNHILSSSLTESIINTEFFWRYMHMYKQLLKAALAVTVVVGTAGTAKADLTLNGNTGMFLNPNAYLVQRDHAKAQINYFELGNGIQTYNIAGVIRAGDRLEIGAGLSKLKLNDHYYGDNTDFILNAKYQLRAPVKGDYALAAGVGYNGALANNKSAYLVASKSFGKVVDKGSVNASVGVRVDEFSDYGPNSSKMSIFGGVAVPVADKLTVIGELQSKNLENYGSTPYSLGVRYRANENFTLSAGLARIGLDYDNGGSKLFAQVGYTFGK